LTLWGTVAILKKLLKSFFLLGMAEGGAWTAAEPWSRVDPAGLTLTAGWIASEPATLVTWTSYAGRNFETESAVSILTSLHLRSHKARAVTVVVLV
jgi:hypothetical protein